MITKVPFFIAIFFNCMTKDSFSSSIRLSFFRKDWACYRNDCKKKKLTNKKRSFINITSSSANLSCSRRSASLSSESWRSLCSWDISSVDFVVEPPDPYNKIGLRICQIERIRFLAKLLPPNFDFCWELVLMTTHPYFQFEFGIAVFALLFEIEPVVHEYDWVLAPAVKFDLALYQGSDPQSKERCYSGILGSEFLVRVCQFPVVPFDVRPSLIWTAGSDSSLLSVPNLFLSHGIRLPGPLLCI